MEDLANIPSSGLRRSARHGHPPKGLQTASSELSGLKGKLDRPTISSPPTKLLGRQRVSPPKKRLGRPPLSPRPSLPGKPPGRKRHIHEWLVEEDDGDEPGVQTGGGAISDAEENKIREPEPHIMIILSSLDLRVVPLQSHNQQGLPYWFIACTRCLRGLEPDDAVTHAAGFPSPNFLCHITAGALRIPLDWIRRTSMDANCDHALFKFLLLTGLFPHNDHLRSGDEKEVGKS